MSSDTGLSLGVFLQLARFEPAARPYAWRARLQAAASFLRREGDLEVPLHDDFARFDVPGFPYPDGRVFVDASYQRFTLAGYYGLGNQSAVDSAVANATVYRGELLALRLALQHRFARSPWRLHTGLGVARYDVEPYSGSVLAGEVAAGVAPNGVGSYTQVMGFGGVVLDTRDHETYPTSGLYHDFVLRAVPGWANESPFSSATLTTRFYVPVAGRYLVFAVRVLGDVIVGDAPLYELSRAFGVNPMPAPGGMNGVRGVPQGRYSGKTKAVGNIEARSLPVAFHMGSDPMQFGAAAFADLGRIWTGSLASEAGPDGSELGLHVGLGGGPRLRWGDALLIRGDVAYAPGASASGRDGALGVYLTTDSPF